MAVAADQAEEVAVVAEDVVGVAGVVGTAGGGVGPGAEDVARDAGAGAAEDGCRRRRAAGRPWSGRTGRAAADDVVLAEVAEDDVAAAAALDVVVAVGAGPAEVVDRPTASPRADRWCRPAVGVETIEPSPWIASLPSSPKISSSPAPPAMMSLPNTVGVGGSSRRTGADQPLDHPGRVDLRRADVTSAPPTPSRSSRPSVRERAG